VKEHTLADRIKKAARHINQSEDLIFQKSAPGKRGLELPPLDVPPADPRAALGSEHLREAVEGFPEVSEIEVIRHFTRLSTWNYAIDLGMYPLGSCTMKYNPRVNEFVARLGADSACVGLRYALEDLELVVCNAANRKEAH